MTQNIYDTEVFFEGYSKMGRSVEGLAGAPEWPALQAMLPPVPGLKVVDLGCGYGWFSRWAQEQGAEQVLGLDVSQKMLARAKEMTSSSAITYGIADLEKLDLPDAAFDLAYSSLAFHYIVDLKGLFARIHQALVPGGRLVFSIEHPIFMAPRQPGWLIDEQGRKSWPVDSYQLEGPRVTNWLAEGVIKQHRTVGTLLTLLIQAGFTLSHVDEWGPSEADLKARPALAEELERPMMLLVAAHR
ncbi:class I SAM-dependent methyltransferase [Pseudomonas sp. CBSPBW29]|jgi:SAM-dependent methyltransferase|uniref:class I SAM-dependent methyltransferase n=1 Tax=Pseudomonas TaxID=286 RepID=UPI0021AD4EAE|nr:class I SAM-dependent methyltransferase [Pseudomonas sp. CBS]WEL42057.1 class I SAM-dependent methyltransferase [Pseudomonas sp. CBSPBW29]WEL63120.1 class I SAM-dependent methyltransferase [Pseudomonas sp. CBSPGW29]WEL72307.1 class I SAM-dependent methyltransferase [Pseudomonas sp. CBSPCGW29]WEL90616.1 class I SAM-dependent methyltransferase [Pseudomonas sp. CBSPCBW29]UVH53425.1 class I SAM-dependent methyltransferase [Pseudomonas sp. CBS]